MPAGLTVTGADVTAVSTGGVCNAGSNSNNLNGGGSPCPFDVGVEIGSQGIGTDDIQSTMFFVTSTAGLGLADFDGVDLGVRLMSVGPDRNGSSKLKKSPPVPEPGSFALFATSALLVSQTIRRRRR